MAAGDPNPVTLDVCSSSMTSSESRVSSKGIVTSSGRFRFFCPPGSQRDEDSYNGYRFPQEIIQQAIWLYFGSR